ncbi:IncF plasmid conjugative transfer pilus assembly protein TraF (plasmid) [Acinetobacter baumannii]|nr:IncF plasmid conjugative transfer pilus assembly protein TraF [Acinetobacter baumannii]QZX59805.1 IncF plasmid conjugative transfer pilus assembly protein TraF [Acinetobacter baumannii]
MLGDITVNKLLAVVVALSAFNLNAKSALDYDSVWKCDNKKMNWYCDEKPQKKTSPLVMKRPVADPQLSTTPLFKDLNKLKTVEELKAEVQNRLNIATMNPSPQNVERYIEANQFMLDKSTVFADQWRRVVYQKPQYDYSLKSPSNNSAIRVQNQVKTDQMDNYLKSLSKEQGLIFFFRSDCPYCHKMAPTLRMLSDKYGIEVLGVTIDGGGLPDFPNPVDGRAVAQNWGIDKVPATFIASKKTKEHAPIGFGVMSLNEVIERIWILTNTKPGQDF